MGDFDKPGVYPSLTQEQYTKIPAVRSSVLKHAKRNALRMRAAHAGVEDPGTRPMRLGDGLHARLLEPERFATKFVRGLDIDRRSKANQAQHLELEELATVNGAEVLPWSDYDAAIEMATLLERRTWFDALLRSSGVNELSIVWDDPEFGVRCKARMDRVAAKYDLPNAAPCSVIVELKSTRSAVKEDFNRDIYRYGYDLQMAMQLEALAEHDPSWRDPISGIPRAWQFLWIAIENKPPYDAAIYTPSDDMLIEGRRRFKAAVGLWAECTRTGYWPGFADTPVIQEVPPWEKGARMSGEGPDDVF